MKQRGQKLICVHRAEKGALCHITESGISVHCALCTPVYGENWDVHIRWCSQEEQVWLKSQPGPIDQREKAQIKELQRSCTQSKGRSPAHGQTEKPCTFYREGKPCTMPQWSQVKNQTLYWRSSTQSAHTQFYTQWGRSLGKLCLDVNDILYFLTVAKKLWLKCNNLFLPSLVPGHA